MPAPPSALRCIPLVILSRAKNLRSFLLTCSPNQYSEMFRSVQHDKARAVQPPRVINIEDLRRAAKRRLPRVVFDYVDGGAEAERTLRANNRAFETVTLRPRCAVATPVCDLHTTVLGTSLSMPVILAPVGSCRLMYPRGEEAAARAAGR